MPRYKPYDLKQSKFIPVRYSDQLIPGTFEHALNEIVEEHLDMTIFDHSCPNCGRRLAPRDRPGT